MLALSPLAASVLHHRSAHPRRHWPALGLLLSGEPLHARAGRTRRHRDRHGRHVGTLLGAAGTIYVLAAIGLVAGAWFVVRGLVRRARPAFRSRLSARWRSRWGSTVWVGGRAVTRVVPRRTRDLDASCSSAPAGASPSLTDGRNVRSPRPARENARCAYEETCMRAAVLNDPARRPGSRSSMLDAPGRARCASGGGVGCCHSDLHVRDGDWPLWSADVLGHEGAAEVARWRGRGRGCGRRSRRSVLERPARRAGLPGGAPWAVLTRAPRQRDGRRHDAPASRPGRTVWPYCGIGRGCERTVVPASAAVPVPRGTCGRGRADRLLRRDGRRRRAQDGAGRGGLGRRGRGLGGVGLSVVMGAALAGADPIVAVDRVAGQARPRAGDRRDAWCDRRRRAARPAAICPAGGPISSSR